MILLFLIVFLLFSDSAFSATSAVYICDSNQQNSIVNIQFDASSAVETRAVFVTSHDYRDISYLYSYPLRFSMRALTDDNGIAKFQVTGFSSNIDISNISCSYDDTYLRQALALAGIVSAGLIFFSILDAM